jgi:hypothetical protein
MVYNTEGKPDEGDGGMKECTAKAPHRFARPRILSWGSGSQRGGISLGRRS